MSTISSSLQSGDRSFLAGRGLRGFEDPRPVRPTEAGEFDLDLGNGQFITHEEINSLFGVGSAPFQGGVPEFITDQFSGGGTRRPNAFVRGLREEFERGRAPTESPVKGSNFAREEAQKELGRLQKAQIQQLKLKETEAKLEQGARARSIRGAKKRGGGSRALLTAGSGAASIGPRNG